MGARPAQRYRGERKSYKPRHIHSTDRVRARTTSAHCVDIAAQVRKTDSVTSAQQAVV
jgi:hypothetical protein